MKDVAAVPRIRLVLFAALVLAAILVAVLIFLPSKPAQPLQVTQPKQMASENADASGAGGPSANEDAARHAAIAAQGPIKHRGTNAADIYKQADALYAQLTDAEKDILKHRNKAVTPDESAALYAKLQPIMDLLRNAQKADYTDWDNGSINPFTNLSARVLAERDLSNMALWESGYRFQSDSAGAVGDLEATESMGRNDVDSLMGLMLQNAIHSDILNLLAQNAMSLSASADLSGLLSGASVTQSFQAGLQAEVEMQRAMVNDYNNPATRSQSYIQTAMSQNSANTPTIADIQWMMQTEQAVATSLTEPNAQFQQWWTQQVSEGPPMPPSEQSFLPELNGIRAKVQASLVQNAMVQAGIALEQNDQAAFQSIVDPISGQPFTYTQNAAGFQLGSVVQTNGKPVTLNFPPPPSK